RAGGERRRPRVLGPAAGGLESVVAARALGAVVDVRQRRALAVALAAVHRRVVVGGHRRSGVVARRGTVTGRAVGGRQREVARHAVLVARRAPRAGVVDRQRLPVAAVARVGAVARRTVLAVHARDQAVAAQPEVVVVVRRRHFLVALGAARLLVAQRAAVGGRGAVRAHRLAVHPLPPERVARRRLVDAHLAVAGRAFVGRALLGGAVDAAVHAPRRPPRRGAAHALVARRATGAA